jgi:HlyD family secretion protein
MKKWIILTCAWAAIACNSNNGDFDAQGTFEANEVMVAAEASGRLIDFPLQEGDSLALQDTVGRIDASNTILQQEQAEASLAALQQKTVDDAPQVKLLQEQRDVQLAQLRNLDKELARAEKLLQQDAATAKQVDDLRFQVESIQKQIRVTEQQIKVQQALVANQNRAILSETGPLQKRAAQLQDLVARSFIINPTPGTVIATYAEQGEMAMLGKPLYKVADLSELTLRMYVTGSQLAQVKLNQEVTVMVDKGAEEYASYKGTIYWIASKAEFTPKTIQTKDERANLVYAIKVRVKNDGLLKIGMYGEAKF